MNAVARATRDEPAETKTAAQIAARVAALDRIALERNLDAYGCAMLPRLLDVSECAAISAMYADEVRFRSRVDMSRHGFGRGEYRHFAYPLPAPIAALRGALYEVLQPLANRWARALGSTRRFPSTHFPSTHADFLAECRAGGQTRPTPLLLRYRAGDYNRLHQDVYGERVFPLQVAVLLSAPGRDFTGGEFMLTEQRARMQSRGEVVPLSQGDAVAFAVRERPATSARGVQRLQMRHGVSRVRSGLRDVAGILFHDAE